MKREADNAWIYNKYSLDLLKARNYLDLIINETEPRYLKGAPEILYQITQRIVDYKIRRAEIKKIDSYFDV